MSVAANLKEVLASIAGKNVRLVAVSKRHPVEKIMEAYNAGQRHFGENYWNELEEKAPQLPKDICWHFIGHLQTRRAKTVAAIADLVETVDSEKLARKLDRAAADREKLPLDVFVQVNTSGEDSKSGATPGEAVALCRLVHEECDNLTLKGLMTIGKLGGDPKEDFGLLAEIRTQVQEALGIDELELSMGMSGDYLVAVEMGSTSIRVGSKIFGERPKT